MEKFSHSVFRLPLRPSVLPRAYYVRLRFVRNVFFPLTPLCAFSNGRLNYTNTIFLKRFVRLFSYFAFALSPSFRRHPIQKRRPLCRCVYYYCCTPASERRVDILRMRRKVRWQYPFSKARLGGTFNPSGARLTHVQLKHLDILNSREPSSKQGLLGDWYIHRRTI